MANNTGDLELVIGSRQASDYVLGREESVLQPGQVRIPAGMEPPTPMDTWARGDSSIWDAKESDNVSTPLTGYGRGDQLWGTSPTAAMDAGFPLPTTVAGIAAATTTAVAAATAAGNNLAAANANLQDNYGFSNRDATREPSFGFGEAKRTASQDLSDELYEQAVTFMPPPPPRVPLDTRRQRAELWYYFASKWDITHRQPPPPRTPLPGMEDEIRFGKPPQTLVPYRGDKWLERCAHWFDWTQLHFQPKVHNPAILSDPEFVIASCVCD